MFTTTTHYRTCHLCEAMCGLEIETSIVPPEFVLDMGLRQGPFQLSLEEVQQHPHGKDLGPLQQQFPERLFTEKGRINLLPELFV